MRAMTVVSVVVIALVGATAQAQVAELSYGGADLSAGNGTMTITCSSTTPGTDVWQLTLVRNDGNGQEGGKITAFDDLTDTGGFTYCTDRGLFHCNNIRADNVGTTLLFEEVTKTAAMYQWRITCVKGYDDGEGGIYPSALTSTHLFTINPATETGTVFTCERTLTNTSGVELPSSVANDRMPTEMYLAHGNYDGDYLTAYEDVGGVYTRIHKLVDDSDAIWKVTDNIINTDANPFWGQGEVLDSDAASALGLTAGRTIKLSSDITSASSRIVQLFDSASLGMLWRIAYANGFGQPSPIPVAWTQDYDVTMDINITNGAVVVGEPDGGTSLVDASPDILTANGFNATVVTTTLKDASGYLVGGKAADLTVEATDTGADNVYGTVAETTEGVYTCTIVSSTPEVKTVVVTYKKGDPGDQVIVAQQPTVTFTDLPDAQLSYTGDIATEDGVLTITSSDRTLGGNVWTIELTRQTGNARRGAIITGFDDLTDSGDFDYCGGGSYGMLNLNNIRNDGAGHTLAFEELYRGTDQYTYKVTCMKPVGVYSSITTEHIYTFCPATPTGTQIRCDRTLTISGDEVTSASYADRLPTEMYLNDNGYDEEGQEDYLSAYQNVLGVWTCWQLLWDDSDAIWQVTDNIENRDGQACWGQGEVMDSDETAALGLVVGRTFKMTTDITSAGGQMVILHPTSGVGLDFRAAYQNGFGALRPAYPVTMDVNITDEPVGVPPVLEVTAALAAGEDWVYQNTETTTADRHTSLATITLVSEASPGEDYTVSIEDNGPGTNVTLGAITDNRPGQQTLTVPIVGGRVGLSTPGAGGAAYTVTLTVEGETSLQSDTADVTLALRYIGDVDGSGAPGAQDKQFFNQRLNNVATAYPDRCYDLNGSGGAPNAEDKQVMNQVLNGVALP